MSIALRPSGNQADRPYMSGGATTLASFIASATKASVKTTLSDEEVSAKNGLIASFVVNDDVIKAFTDLGAPAELLAAMSGFLTSRGRADGTLPYVVSAFANVSKQDGHIWVGLKANQFLTAQPAATEVAVTG